MSNQTELERLWAAWEAARDAAYAAVAAADVAWDAWDAAARWDSAWGRDHELS